MASETSHLRARIATTGAALAVLVVAGLAYLADRSATAQLDRTADQRVAESAQRAADLVGQYLEERRQDAELLAQLPATASAARAGADEAQRRRLVGRPVAQLERDFDATRSLGGDPALRRFLIDVQDRFDFAEVFFTDRNGYNVVTTDRTSDFVQSDEAWWQRAFATGFDESAPQVDQSAGVVAVQFSVRIADPASKAPLGVLRAVLRLGHMNRLVLATAVSGARIEVVDSAARVIVSPDTARVLKRLPDSVAIPLEAHPAVARVRGDIVATAPTHGGRWWVVERQPEGDATAAAAPVHLLVYGTSAAALLLLLIAVRLMIAWLDRHVTQPVVAAGNATSRVAAGDLTVNVDSRGAEDEVGHLLASVQGMVVALRHLVGAIRTSAEDSAAMAEEISASTEEMSASTQELADTCQKLTTQATDQADLVRKVADDAAQILAIATSLADGARGASERNTDLTSSAERHRDRLKGGSAQLAQLAGELDLAAAEATALATMSAEIQKFVTQAQTIANQTNMLALNAAIEAARAGSEGQGFAVVADEVRKLATRAAQAAASTSETVRGVLRSVQDTRERLQRLSAGSAAVREVADDAARGMQEVSDAAAESSAWTGEISGAAGEVRRLVEEISSRLSGFAEGTDGFVSAVEQIAASAEEQNASTQEIASSAAQLAQASERLTEAVSTFRLAKPNGPPAV